MYTAVTIGEAPRSTLIGLASPARIDEAPAMPSARGSHAAAKLSDHVVVVSGSSWSADRTTKSFLSDTLLFNGDGRWTSGPQLPHPAVEAAYASDGERLYIIGGLRDLNSPSGDVFALSLDNSAKLRIAKLPEFPSKHVGGAAAIVDNQLFVVGGYADGKVTNKVWTLDCENIGKGWSEGPALPAEARAYAALINAGRQLYLLGGMTTDGEKMRVFKDVFQFAPADKSWQRLGELPAAGYCWTAAVANTDEDMLLVAGRADGAIHDDIWLVDLSNLSTRGLGRSVITTTCAPLIRIDDTTYWLIGGEPDANKTRTARVTQIRLPE
jgi:N-acetylneuraminic acid mutarotase